MQNQPMKALASRSANMPYKTAQNTVSQKTSTRNQKSKNCVRVLRLTWKHYRNHFITCKRISCAQMSKACLRNRKNSKIVSQKYKIYREMSKHHPDSFAALKALAKSTSRPKADSPLGPLRWDPSVGVTPWFRAPSVVSGSLRGVGLPPWFRSRKERDKEIKKWSGCCGKRHCFACSRGVRMDGSCCQCASP